jgi:hypothetical protein
MHVFSFIRAICLIFEMLYFVGHTSENIGECRERCIKSVKFAAIACSVKQQRMEAHTQTLPLTLYISLHPLINHGKQTDRRTNTNTPEIPGFGSVLFRKLDPDPHLSEKLDPDARNGPQVYTVDQWSQIPITLMRSRIWIRIRKMDPTV